jgi:hypothetical protein
MIQTYEAVYESGVIRLPADVRLPEHTMVYVVVPQGEEKQIETPKNLYDATPEERARALDEIAEMNKDVPVLPPEAYNRESLYEETY